MAALSWSIFTIVIGFAASASSSLSSGLGAVGQGRSLFSPPCGFACLDVFWALKLPCSEKDPNPNTTFSINTPVCHESSLDYLESLAWCLQEHCREDGLTNGQIQHVWSRIAGDEQEVGLWTTHLNNPPQSVLQKGSVALTELSSVSPAAYNASRHTVLSYADQEKYHALWSTVLIAVSVGLGLLIGLTSRFNKSLHYAISTPSIVNKYLLHPAFIGKRNLQMLPGNVGYVPQRSTTLLIIIFVAVNVALNFVNTPTFNNDTWFVSSSTLFTSNLANRLSVLAIANLALAIMLSGRNSTVLYLTGCSRTTIIAFHRWAGRIAIIKGVAHGAMYLSTSDKYGMKVFTPAGALHYIGCTGSYWEFGIASLAIFAAILLFSLAPVRVYWYEAFLVSHVILGIAVLVTIWYHLVNRFHGQYGYEVWLYIAFAFWAFDRIVRVIRIAILNYGWLIGRDPPAKVELLPDSQLIRVTAYTSAKGPSKPGQYCFVYFPTLSWYIESHPFSIISWESSNEAERTIYEKGGSSAPTITHDPELGVPLTARPASGSPLDVTLKKDPESVDPHAHLPRMTFIIRPCSGMTRRLQRRLAKSHTLSLAMPALIEGPYNSSTSSDKIMACDTVIAFAGGIGVTGILSYLNKHVANFHPPTPCRGGVRPRPRLRPRALRFVLIWMVSSSAEAEALSLFPGEAVLEAAHVELRIVCKEKGDARVDFGTEILKEKTAGGSKTSTGVLVCGPAQMADEIRSEVVKADRMEGGRLELCIEAFGW